MSRLTRSSRSFPSEVSRGSPEGSNAASLSTRDQSTGGRGLPRTSHCSSAGEPSRTVTTALPLGTLMVGGTAGQGRGRSGVRASPHRPPIPRPLLWGSCFPPTKCEPPFPSLMFHRSCSIFKTELPSPNPLHLLGLCLKVSQLRKSVEVVQANSFYPLIPNITKFGGFHLLFIYLGGIHFLNSSAKYLLPQSLPSCLLALL